ncbi:MAG: serpin family protein [Firmicutes bacterium]|jgi:serpin B|nr:serpin family protein [Bacillota bacterium]
MKRASMISGVAVLLLCVLATVSCGFDAGVSARNKADIDSVAAGNNSFAFDLYSRLARGEGNVFFSPYSISSALAMTYAGARGETAKQMAHVLHFSLAPERLHAALSDLTAMFNDPGRAAYSLSVANALWGQVGYTFRPEFLDIAGRYYGAGFKEVDYIDDANREQTRQTINGWVEAKTNNKIKDLIKPYDLTALTRLVLTNAIYFKGKWEFQFKPENTKTMPFHISDEEQADVPMMHQMAEFRYAENDQVQILEMPYTGGDLSMVILLPKPGYGIEALEGTMCPENTRSWLSQLSREKVEVFLPRFKLETRLLLNGGLQDLGMIDAFDEYAADFSGMTPGRDLYISKVIHQAFVEVNEEGTEAAAATAVMMSGKSILLDVPPVFRADRPFAFLIRDLRSGSILFMGRLVDPRG